MEKLPRAVQIFLDLTKIDCESFHERKMADELTGRLKALGLTVLEDQSGAVTGSDAGNLYAVLPASEGISEEEYPPVLASGHMDTVVPGKGRKAAIDEKGRITSDGTTVLGADDEANLAAILDALETIVEKKIPHGEIEILFTTGEEAYTVGASAFDFSCVRAKRAYVADASDKMGGYSVHEPSLISFKIHVKGKAAHAGFEPEKGINALKTAALAIAAIPQGRVDPRSTFNIGLLKSGTATNAVPEEAEIAGELRSLDHAHALDLYDSAVAEFEKAAKKTGASVSAEKTVHLYAYHVPEDDPALVSYKKALEQVGLTPHPYPCFGGSDINVFRRNGIDGICIANSMYNCHTVREYAFADEIVQLSKIYTLLLTEKVR